jgi:hypothetical protein
MDEERRLNNARHKQAAEDRRGEVIDALLSGANTRSETEKPEAAPAKQAAPAN